MGPCAHVNINSKHTTSLSVNFAVIYFSFPSFMCFLTHLKPDPPPNSLLPIPIFSSHIKQNQGGNKKGEQERKEKHQKETDSNYDQNGGKNNDINKNSRKLEKLLTVPFRK